MISEQRRKLWHGTKVLLGAVALGLLMWQLIQNAPAGAWARLRQHPGMAWLALGCGLVFVCSQFMTWWLLVNRNGKTLGLVEGYNRYSSAWLSRYLPAGNILQFVALFNASDNVTLQIRCVGSLGLSILCGLLAGSLVVTLGAQFSPTLGIRMPFMLAGVSLGVLGVIGISRPSVLNRLAQRFGMKSSLDLSDHSIRPAHVAQATTIHLVFGWMLQAVIIVLMLKMLDFPVPIQTATVMLTTYAVASFGSFLIPLTPAGIGIREGLWVYLVREHIPAFHAVFAALGLRFILSTADLLFLFPFAGRVVRKVLRGRPPSISRST